MPVTCFYDGRILIATVRAPTSVEEFAAGGEALCGTANARRSPVLVDARGAGAVDLAHGLDQLLGCLDRPSRLAVLSGAQEHAAQGLALRGVAAGHGAEALVFENLGLALRWIWGLDAVPRATATPRPSMAAPNPRGPRPMRAGRWD